MIQSNVLSKTQPWSPSDATDAIRTIARGIYDFHLTAHAAQQMRDRDLSTGDVTYIAKNGFVYEMPENASQANHYKYCMESTTPNTSRTVRIVVIPSVKPLALKIITAMWRDEVSVGR